jgi:hypothetical protein
LFVPSPCNLVGNLLQPKSANQAAEDHEIIIMSATILPLKKKTKELNPLEVPATAIGVGTLSQNGTKKKTKLESF